MTSGDIILVDAPRQIRSTPTQNLILLLKQAAELFQCPQLGRLSCCKAGSGFLTFGDRNPVLQRRAQRPETIRNLRRRRLNPKPCQEAWETLPDWSVREGFLGVPEEIWLRGQRVIGNGAIRLIFAGWLPQDDVFGWSVSLV